MSIEPTTASEVRKIVGISLLLNIVLAGIKLICGFAGTSQALIADAVHTLSDSVTDVAVITGAAFWTRPPDPCHPYGHRRIETLITTAIGAVLLAVAIGIGWQALTKLRTGPNAAPGWIAFAAALLSIVSKESLYRWSNAAGKRLKSSAVVANAWHQRSDALSSIPVALAVAGNALFPSMWFLDSVGALLVAIFIIRAAWDICRPALRELIDAGAPGRIIQDIRTLSLQVEGVRQVHAVRTRYFGNSMLVDLHILVDPGLTVRDGHAIAETVERRLVADGPDIADVLVHIEPFESKHAL